MANKSSKSYSGEERDQPAHRREDEINREDILKNSGEFEPQGTREGKQDNLQNRGYDEDQPGQPVRNTGSLSPEQQDEPAGEPDTWEQKQNLSLKNDRYDRQK